MPVKKSKYTRRAKPAKKTYKKRSRYSLNTSAMTVGGFPQRMRVKLVYTHQYGDTATIGYDIRQYNLNSLYDPDRSGTGHQPMHYDQLTAIYNRYRVLSAKVTISYSLCGANGAICAVLGSNSDTSITNYNELLEQPIVSSKTLAYLGDPVVIVKKFSLAKLSGATRTEYKGSDRYEALTNASPTETLIAHVGIADLKYASFAYTYNIKIEYIADMFDIKQTTES